MRGRLKILCPCGLDSALVLFFGGRQWHLRQDLCSPLRFRLNHQRTADKAKPLPHSDQSDSATRVLVVSSKAFARIGNAQPDTIRVRSDRNLCTLGFAMFYNVPKGLLSHSK